MIDIIIRYQATIFVNAQEIGPTPDIIGSLITLFHDKGLIPSTFRSMSLSGAYQPQLRIRFMSPDNQWNISFAPNRIDIDKNLIGMSEKNIGDISTFSSEASELFNRVMTTYKKKANRLAINSTVLFKEMTEEHLNAAYYKLFIATPTYKKYPPFEWIWKTCSRLPYKVSDLEDNINIVTDLQRIKGEYSDGTTIIKLDRLKLLLDINTTDLNLEYRFDNSHMIDYFSHISVIHDKQSNEIQEYING
jgi:hypothetical protein